MQKKNELDDYRRRFTECDTKFNAIFDLTSAASKIIRSDLTILKVNAALCELLGYAAQEIEGTKILDHACEEHIAHWHHLQEELWSRAVPFFKLHACLYKKDRTLVWVEVTTILYKDQGETFGFTVLDDITALKSFRENKQRLDLALKYSETAIWELNLHTDEVFRSENHDQVFGYQQRKSTWKMEEYYSIILAEDLPSFKAAVSAAITIGEIDIQARVMTPDKSLKWVNMKGKTETDSQGNAQKLIGVITDITKDKLIEGHKDDFISIASHELKTPVTSLMGSLQLLNKISGDLPGRVKLLLQQANKGVNRISVIIDDLLNAGGQYQQQLSLKKTEINLYQLAQECSLQFEISDSNPITVSGDKAVLIHADGERINRVLTNLIGNALKYAPASGEINVTVHDAGELVKVSVKDLGPGISLEKIPLLFDRYYQGEIDHKRYSGLGLGLFISADIVRRHGGEIRVDSQPGRGSTFWFTLPKACPYPVSSGTTQLITRKR